MLKRFLFIWIKKDIITWNFLFSLFPSHQWVICLCNRTNNYLSSQTVLLYAKTLYFNYLTSLTCSSVMLQYHVKQSWAQWCMSVGKEETDWCCAELLDECLVSILQIQNKPLTLYKVLWAVTDDMFCHSPHLSSVCFPHSIFSFYLWCTVIYRFAPTSFQGKWGN